MSQISPRERPMSFSSRVDSADSCLIVCLMFLRLLISTPRFLKKLAMLANPTRSNVFATNVVVVILVFLTIYVCVLPRNMYIFNMKRGGLQLQIPRTRYACSATVLKQRRLFVT